MGRHSSLAEGFALVALVVFALAWAAIPNFRCEARPGVDERFAIETLRMIAAAETAARSGSKLDSDGDGVAEYVGLRALREHGLLSPGFAVGDGTGIVDRGTYRFQLWLPALGGGFARADQAGVEIDGPRAAHEFRAYAWPVVFEPGYEPEGLGSWFGDRARQRTIRVFCLDASGEIRANANVTDRFAGSHAPAADAAFGPDGSAWTAIER